MLNGFSGFGLGVFVVVIFCVVRPIRIPLPTWFQALLARVFYAVRLSDKSVESARSERWHFKLGLEIAPVIGVLVLLATTAINGEVIKLGIVGDSSARPYDVLVLFICLAYIAIALDATGALRHRSEEGLSYHPDKNAGNAEAEQKFKDIGEAYQVLSDSNLRATYNKYGKKKAGDDAGGGMQDPGAFFADVFGGANFEDWIGEVALGKQFQDTLDVSMTQEEKDALNEEMARPGSDSASIAKAAPKADTVQAIDASAHASFDEPRVSPINASVNESTTPVSPSTATPTTATTTNAAKPASPAAPAGKDGKTKLTPEQRAQLVALQEKQHKEKLERIEKLTKKLIERCRPFERATKPGDIDDPETKAFEFRIKEEVSDLKMASFGIELCHLIGNIYFNKASTYIRLHRKGVFSNFAGVPGFLAKMKDKKDYVKEGWSFISTGMEMAQEMQKTQDLPEDDMQGLDQDLIGKLLLVSWKGTKFEVAGILRTVVDQALSKDSTTTEALLMNRAKAILLIGTIMKAVEPDEGADERREMERLMAQASAKRKAPKKKGGSTPAATSSRIQTS